MRKKIIILAGEEDTTGILYARLSHTHDIVGVVIESPVPKRILVKWRLKHCGIAQVIGQVLFVCCVLPFLEAVSASRMRTIVKSCGGSTQIPDTLITRVPTINHASVAVLLASVNPDMVVVHGTRIIKRATLAALPSRFVNIHAGITPRYKGAHGAYWALVEGRPEWAGVTLHYVDEGIDTGAVIAHARITPTHEDSFVTYPLLQLCAGLSLLERFLSGEEALPTIPIDAPPRVWYHPTLWGYLVKRIVHGVR